MNGFREPAPRPKNPGEGDSTRPEIEALREDRERLEADNRTLREEKALGDEETGRLREEVARSRRMEELLEARLHRRAQADPGGRWRARGGGARGERSGGHRPSAADVLRPAAHQAQLALERGHALRDPTEVFDALAWLATAYRNGPTDRIGETCPGWFYKSNQSATTMGRFRDWYRTRVDGTAWKLAAHLGKGTGHDPHHTIRIAFAWDEQDERVIVGFVGLLQRNRAS